MLVLFLWLKFLSVSDAFDCRAVLEDVEVTNLDWPNLEHCLTEVSGESLTQKTYENIWRLVKNTFGGIENIPTEVYGKLGYALTEIPVNELYNISMERVETVEAFGAISKSFDQSGFKAEQIQLIAQKTRQEWLGKNPHTYSEYDLMSMGEILCYLNVSDILDIHPDAFILAAEWIGKIKTCPQEALEALAKLATNEQAFGPAKNWSKLEVSIIGNVINGLPDTEINSIDKDKLHLNKFYRANYSEMNLKNSVQNVTANNHTNSTD